MKNPFLRFIGILIILLSNIFFIGTIVIFTFEVFEISKKLDGKFVTKSKRFPLHKTNYYGEKKKESPYNLTEIKYLHPHYLFSLPIIDQYVKKTNNEIFSINEHGFRNNPYYNKLERNIVLLGGSTAFSNYSSSDKTSISAYLSNNTKFSVVNRNSPGWNTLQELLALLKYNKKYEISLSVSLYNDLSTYCDGYRHFKYTDTQSKFFYWSNIVENEKYPYLDDSPFNQKIKYFLIKNFPETKDLYKNIKRKLKNINKKNNDNILAQSSSYCGNSYKEAINSFLMNQKLMREVSNSRGAKHILIIQPIFSLHLNAGDGAAIVKSKEQIKFQRKAIDYLMQTKFCEIDCYDFSNIFDILNKVELINSIRNNKYENQIFVDNAHLTDFGNKIISEQILKLESFK